MKSKRSASRSSQNRVSRASARSSLAPQLAAYSTTALAALALAPTAHAQIIPITSFYYNGGYTTTPPSLNFTSGVQKLSFYVSHLKTGTGVFVGNLGGFNSAGHEPSYYRRASAFFSGNFATANGGYHTVLKLNLGDKIAAQNFFNGPDDYLAYGKNAAFSGNFAPNAAHGFASGYVAFKGTYNAKSYYGWLKVKVGADGAQYPNSVTLASINGSPGIYGAYEISTAPDINNFAVGQIPEPSDAALGLGLLAFGAAGVRELRKRRKMVA